MFEPAGDKDRHEQSLFFVCLVAYATLSSCQHRYLINIIENEFKERSFQNENLFYLFDAGSVFSEVPPSLAVSTSTRTSTSN